MKRNPNAFWTVCLLIFLASLVAARISTAGHGKAKIPVGEFHARRFAAPPTIDGNVEPGEWDEALTVSGAITIFSHKLLQAETTWSFGFDDERFYFLADCTRGLREWKLWKTARENDAYSFGDPSVEIWVSPPKPVEETYQNIINTYPAVMDVKNIPSRGYSAMGWTGDWKLAVDERADRYLIEASIRIDDFGIETVQNGDVWKFLLARTSPGSKPRAQASWGVTGGFGEIAGYPDVHLMDDTALLQVHRIVPLFKGQLGLPMAVVAPRGRDEVVTVKVRVQDAVEPDDEDKVLTRKVTVKQGERKEFTFKGDVGEFNTGFVTISATTQDGTGIYRHTLPFTVNDFEHRTPVKPEKAPEVEPLALKAMYGPENNVVLVKADIIDLDMREEVSGSEVTITDPETGKVLQREAMPTFRHWYSNGPVYLGEDIEVPVFDVSDVTEEQITEINAHNRQVKQAKEKLKKLKKRKNPDPEEVAKLENVAERKLRELPRPDVKPRTVAVKVTVRNEDGEAIASNSKQVGLLRRKFRWQSNDIGVTEEVIPPWEPVTYDAGEVGVWNRSLGVNGLGLLESVDNGGVDQVESMRLVAVVDGEKKVIEPSEPRLQKHVDAYAVVEGSGSGAGLDLSATTKVEFDGYAFSELTIAPAGETGQVDKLYLEVVLPEEEATHFCTTAGGWAAMHDVTPDYWSSQQTSSGLLIGDFVPYIWLTNSDRAFVWLADNDKGWITDDDKSRPTQEIVREDGTVTLRVHFIELPTNLTEPTTVRYGYQTFPSRPLPDGWRSVICNQNKGELPDARNTYFWFDGNWAVLWPYYSSPYPWSMAKSRELFDRFEDSPDHRPMVGSIAHAIARYRDYDGYEFPNYVVDWGAVPGNRSNGNCTQCEGTIDFRLYHYRRWVREAGFRGLYVDENYLGLNSNFLTGGAYLRPDGRLQRSYDYTGLREYFKRMKVMYHNNDVPRPNLWQHISSGAAYFAWFGDIFFEGENVEPSNLEYDYLKVLPAGRMRAIASAKTSGGVMTMMCQSQRHRTVFEPKHTHQFVGWVMAHDVLPEQVAWYNIMAQEARFYRADVRFHGYWKDDNPVEVGTEGSIASVHSTDGRALVWVVNKLREDRTVDLEIDLEALGLDADIVMAVDAETGQVLPLAGGALSLPVLKRDFKAFHLIEARGAAEGLRFRATFEDGEPRADYAVGSNRLTGAARSELEITEGSDGRGLSAPAALPTHLNLAADRGRLVFDAKLPDKNRGTVLNLGALSLALAGNDGMALVSNRNPIASVYHGRPRRGKDKEKITRATFPAPEAGWHTIEVTWSGGKATVQIDGQAAAQAPLVSDWLGAVTPRGPQLRTVAAAVFGGRRNACEAIDNIRCYAPQD